MSLRRRRKRMHLDSLASNKRDLSFQRNLQQDADVCQTFQGCASSLLPHEDHETLYPNVPQLPESLFTMAVFLSCRPWKIGLSPLGMFSRVFFFFSNSVSKKRKDRCFVAANMGRVMYFLYSECSPAVQPAAQRRRELPSSRIFAPRLLPPVFAQKCCRHSVSTPPTSLRGATVRFGARACVWCVRKYSDHGSFLSQSMDTPCCMIECADTYHAHPLSLALCSVSMHTYTYAYVDRRVLRQQYMYSSS